MKKFIKIVLVLSILSLALTGCGGKKNYETALEHHSNGNKLAATHYFAKADGYRDSANFLTEYLRTNKHFIGDSTDSLALVNGRLKGTGIYAEKIEYEDDFAALAQRDDIVSIDGEYSVMALCSNGKVLTAGFDDFDAEHKAEIESWENIKYILYSGFVQIGIQENGVVRYAGNRADDLRSLNAWTDMIKIVGDDIYLAGLNLDGKIWIAAKIDTPVDSEFEGWYDVTDVVDIEMTSSHSLVMLKKDGTVQLLNGIYPGYGGNDSADETMQDVKMWKDIKDIAVSDNYIHGVTFDGKIVSTNYDIQKAAENLENIVSVENYSVNSLAVAIDQTGKVYEIPSFGKVTKLKDITLLINENY